MESSPSSILRRLELRMNELHQRSKTEGEKAMTLALSSSPVDNTPQYLRRMSHELRWHLKLEDPWDPYVTWAPIEGNIQDLLAALRGPLGSVYEEGIFFLRIHIPLTYPSQPPIVKFLTQIYHPNIDAQGRLGLDILDCAWSPILTINSMLTTLLGLLSTPNGDEYMEEEIATQFKGDRDLFEAMARSYTTEHASGELPDLSASTVDDSEWWHNAQVYSSLGNTVPVPVPDQENSPPQDVGGT